MQMHYLISYQTHCTLFCCFSHQSNYFLERKVLIYLFLVLECICICASTYMYVRVHAHIYLCTCIYYIVFIRFLREFQKHFSLKDCVQEMQSNHPELYPL